MSCFGSTPKRSCQTSLWVLTASLVIGAFAPAVQAVTDPVGYVRDNWNCSLTSCLLRTEYRRKVMGHGILLWLLDVPFSIIILGGIVLIIASRIKQIVLVI